MRKLEAREMKINDLDEKPIIKEIMLFCKKPKRSVSIAVNVGKSLHYIRSEILPVMLEKNYLVKIKSDGGKIIYKTRSE